MDDIFSKEEKVIKQAEDYISFHHFNTQTQEENYRTMLNEYKKLLKQMKRLVKMSDSVQLELKNLSDKLQVASQTDPLTGLFNRRVFDEVYLREWKNALRSKINIALIMIDIDYFKKYNDTYGHLLGDECLKAVARQIQDAVKRPRDVAARFGGEEFVILLPETDSEGAAMVAQRIISGIASLNMEHAGSPLINRVTISLGIAAIVTDENYTMAGLLSNADTALYNAKEGGRNGYRVYNPSDSV